MFRTNKNAILSKSIRDGKRGVDLGVRLFTYQSFEDNLIRISLN